MATNYLGPFLLTVLLLPSLRRSGSKVSHTTMEQTYLQLASMPAENLGAVVSDQHSTKRLVAAFQDLFAHAEDVPLIHQNLSPLHA